MPISIKDFVAQFEQRQPDAQANSSTASFGATAPSSGICVYCGKPLREMKTGSRPTSRGRSCSDCYFREMGKWIAAHPIRVPEE